MITYLIVPFAGTVQTMQVIETSIDSHGSKNTTIKSEAFEQLNLCDMPVPDSEIETIESIGQMVRSLNNDDTADCDVTVERVDLVNDSPFYNMTVEFERQFPIVLQNKIGDEWSLKTIRNCEGYTVVQVRYDKPLF